MNTPESRLKMTNRALPATFSDEERAAVAALRVLLAEGARRALAFLHDLFTPRSPGSPRLRHP